MTEHPNLRQPAAPHQPSFEPPHGLTAHTTAPIGQTPQTPPIGQTPQTPPRGQTPQTPPIGQTPYAPSVTSTHPSTPQIGQTTPYAHFAQTPPPIGAAPYVPTGPQPPQTTVLGGATPPQPRRATRLARTIVAVAALTALAGGAGYGGAAWYGHTAAASNTTTTITRVEQGSTSAPDWSKTAAAALPSTVSVTVTSSAGEGQGAGVIWDTAGHVVTNNHVASALGANATVTVTLTDHTVYQAKVVATDPTRDLAVLQIVNPPSTLVPIQVADSSSVAVGDPIMAIGNPLGLDSTVTTGVVSALNRPVTTTATTNQGSNSRTQAQTTASNTVVTDAIQVSAAINPGNSGGALVNANGQLIGINFSIASLGSSGSSESGSIGIGFAIPSNEAKSVVEQLISGTTPGTPTLGVSTSDGTGALGDTQRLGAVVKSVVSGSAADSAGIKAGDVVIAIGGEPVTGSESLAAEIRSYAIGSAVPVQVLRNGTTVTVTVTLK